MSKKTVLGKIALGLVLGCIILACAQASKPELTPILPSTTLPLNPQISATPTLFPTIKSTMAQKEDTTPTGTFDSSVDNLVLEAKEDLAGRLSVDMDQISLVEAKSIFWRDASLGCPQPGMVYAQVITPGFRITLEAKGQIYDYHTDTSRYVFLCETKETPLEPVPLMPVAPHDKPPKCKRTPCP